jgi:phosphatidylglycerol:prolipoprotein diacylglycerol transferase
MSESYFVWDMNKEIWHIAGAIGLRWYSLMFVGGFLLGTYMFGSFLRKEGKRDDYRDSLLMHLVLGTIIGARLGHCLFYAPGYYLSNPLEICKVWEGGLASHGGYIGIIIAIWLFARKHKEISFLWLLDRLCILSIMVGGLIRIGNFFNSEIVGKVAQVPWAIVFKQVDPLPRHPTQLYEALGYFVISGILYGLYRLAHRNPVEGRIFGISLIIGMSFRLFIETFKENQEIFENGMVLNMGQLLSIPFILVGVVLAIGVKNMACSSKSGGTRIKLHG